MPSGTLCPGSQLVIREIKILFMPNSKREFVPRDQVLPLIFIYCLLLLPENKQFHVLSITIVPHSFFLLIFYSEKFSTWIWHWMWILISLLVCVIGLHAVQFGNNWMKKIPRAKIHGLVQFSCQRNFLNSVISKLDKHVVLLLINYIAG